MKITTHHQLVLKRLSLPLEIIDIIKNMAFDDDITYKSKKNKKLLISILNTSIYMNEVLLRNTLGTAITSSSSITVKYNNHLTYIKSIYCLKCGEEVWRTYLNALDIRCLCDENHLSLLDYSNNNKYKKNIYKFSVGLSFILSGIISYFVTRNILDFIIFINS